MKFEDIVEFFYRVINRCWSFFFGMFSYPWGTGSTLKVLEVHAHWEILAYLTAFSYCILRVHMCKMSSWVFRLILILIVLVIFTSTHLHVHTHFDLLLFIYLWFNLSYFCLGIMWYPFDAAISFSTKYLAASVAIFILKSANSSFGDKWCLHVHVIILYAE